LSESVLYGLGTAKCFYHIACQYVLDRKQFGLPIRSYQLIQKEFANICTKIILDLERCYRGSRITDQNFVNGDFYDQMKFLTKSILNIARECRDMLDANGISEGYNVIRDVLNLEAVNTHEGTYNNDSLILSLANAGFSAFGLLKI
jgi:glutaryl-CoA dehydrogenase